jgi:subtilisin family serine protease
MKRLDLTEMRTERHVVIKRSAELEAGIELAGPDEEYLGLPFEIATEDLTDSEAADRRRDERVEDVMPSINLSLIAPLDVPSQSGEAGDAWGIAAVGADRCVEDGRGVTVAILDTGIDRHHSAFAKTNLQLVDFVADPEGEEGRVPDEPGGHGTHVAGTAFGAVVEGKRIGSPRVSTAL